MPPSVPLSVPSDLTVLGVLLLCMCLYIPGLAWCLRADAVSAGNRRVHYLSDNSPADQYLYAVTVHTGLCSAARMSAKVRLVFVLLEWLLLFTIAFNCILMLTKPASYYNRNMLSGVL